jgi:serine protease Do
MEGFRKALIAALTLHKGYPANKASLAGKQPRSTRFKTPEDFPSLAGKYKPTLDYEGKVVQSCLHCHQVRDAERRFFRDDKKPIPDTVLYPYPMPNAAGFSLDPKEQAKVTSVAAGSPAEKAGFKVADEILSLEGQPILSIADVQWSLHHAGEPATLNAQILRKRKRIKLALDLAVDWRRQSDIAWRTTTWDLRRMVAGGMVLQDSTTAERRAAKLPENTLALRVSHVGEYGDHAVAKRAGFKKDDILLSVDGQNGHLAESGLFRYLLQRKMPGEKIPVTVLRDGERMNLELLMQ